MVGLDGVVMDVAHVLESLFKTMLHKPNCSSGHIRHYCGTLDLYELGGVVEMDRDSTRGTLV